jgi:hypothetical protein
MSQQRLPKVISSRQLWASASQPVDIHVSQNRGDGQNLNPWRLQRHDQRNCIIGSYIGVNHKWKFHATQNNKLLPQKLGSNIQVIDLSGVSVLTAPWDSNFRLPTFRDL